MYPVLKLYHICKSRLALDLTVKPQGQFERNDVTRNCNWESGAEVEEWEKLDPAVHYTG